MTTWRLNPILPELNTPPYNTFSGDSVPAVDDVTALLGLTDALNITLTEVTPGFYVYTFGLGTVPCVFTLVKYDE